MKTNRAQHLPSMIESQSQAGFYIHCLNMVFRFTNDGTLILSIDNLIYDQSVYTSVTIHMVILTCSSGALYKL